MTTILGLSGSLRSGSLNSSLLRAAVGQMPTGVTLETGSIKGIPLYDGDLEAAQGLPDAVAKLKERVVATDGLLLVTPEYNNGIPGVFKNAIDWLSRPSADIPRVFGNRPVAVMGASPGRLRHAARTDGVAPRAEDARHGGLLRRPSTSLARRRGVRRRRNARR